MFERLFTSPRALARQQNGPLAEERRRYLEHCAAQQMTYETLRSIAGYTLVIANALRLAERSGELITRTEIDAEADRWVNRPVQPPKEQRMLTFTGHAIRWLAFLERLEQPKTAERPYADHVAQFSEYQLRERGLSAQTIAYAARTLLQFLAQIDEAKLQLKTLTVAQVDELRYLWNVRARSDHREVFLTLIAPYRPLAVDGLGEVVRRRLHALQLKLPHYGSHVLRHACATHLLEQGLSLKEIGDHLGHRSPQTTRIYAKVDLAALRIVGDFQLEDLL